MSSLPRSMSAADVAHEVQTGEPPMSSATALSAPRAESHAVQVASEPLSPMALIQLAIETKTPALELKELVALAEHVEERSNIREFNRALSAFQKECPPIKKNRTAKITTRSGPGFSYTYAELDEIERHIKPHLERHGFSYTFDTDVDDKGVMLTNVCTLLHENGHSRSSRFKLPIANESAASPQQKVGIADSYAKRRALAAVLGLNITDKEAPDEEIDPTPISEDQAIVISDMIDELAKTRTRVRERFFKYMDVMSVDEIRAADYEKAIAALKPEAK